MAASVQPLPDPNAPPKLTLANGGLAGAPQAPGQAGGTPPTLSLAAPAIPAPTVAAPSAPVDRLQLATSNFNNLAQSTDPAYQQSLREATSQAAGAGQLGSGQLRTSIGDLALARQRDLDTQRTSLSNAATEGSIADASTAYQQQLAAAQQGLAGTVAGANISQGQQAQDTARLGTTGSLANQAGQLELAKGEATGSLGGQQTLGAQQLDLAKKTADINAQFQAGTLTLAQKDQALKELSNQQQYGLAGQQLELAKTGQEADIANKQAQIDLATKSLAQSGLQFNANLAEQTASRLQQGAQFDASQAQSADQFKASLAQNAEQFGLSQQQTQALAKLQNDTANKSIDATTAQGQNQLLIQLAAIIGGPTGSANPSTMQAIAQKFGIILPKTPVSDPTNPTDTGTGKRRNPDDPTVDGRGGDGLTDGG